MLHAHSQVYAELLYGFDYCCLMIDVRRLRMLEAVHRHHTVTAAARALHMTPGAVSQQLAALARETGSPLLERQGRGVKLTGAARILLDHAPQIFAELERIKVELGVFSGGVRQATRICAFAEALSGLVVPAIGQMRMIYPDWHFTIMQAEPGQSARLLLDNDVDMAITVLGPGFADYADQQLAGRLLMRDPYDFIAPPSHHLAARSRIQLSYLAGETWILPTPHTVSYQYVMWACHQQGFQPPAVHVVDDIEAAMALVAAGFGVALLPRLAWRKHNQHDLLTRPLAAGPHREIWALLRLGSNPPLLDVLQSYAASVARS